jgi:hypothetical protein
MEQRIHPSLIVVSSSQAEHQLQTWLRENNFEDLTDADGVRWKISIKMENHADPVNRHGSIVQAVIAFESLIDTRTLLATRTFDETNDERLLGLFSHRVIHHKLPSMTLIANSSARLRTDFAAQLIELRKSFAAKSFKAIRQQAVREAINNAGRFSSDDKDVITIQS